MLVEDTIVPAEALPIAAFREHLRMGTGFADDALQDGLLERHLRAALAAIEARTGKILIARTFVWTVSEWRDAGEQTLPVAPISAVSEVTLVDRLGAETLAPVSSWHLIEDAARPRLVAPAGVLPTISSFGRARVGFVAGFGPAWADVPGDLAQAVFLLAGHFYEFRHAAEGRGVEIPSDVAALIAPHRNLRVYLGGRS